MTRTASSSAPQRTEKQHGSRRSPSRSATFYFMVDIKASGLGSERYAERLLRERSIAVVPGCYYGASTDGFVRVGIGTEPMERIEAALEQMRATLG